jgi:superkiller protein 3
MTTAADLFARAWQYHQANDHAQAERLYRELLQSNPAHADGWCFLGAVCQAQGNTGEAERCYRRALALVPGFASAHNCLGILLAEQGRPDEAAASFEQLLRLQPDDADAWNNLGLVRARQGRVDEAVASYQRALQLRPGFPAARANLDQALRARDRSLSSSMGASPSAGAVQTAEALNQRGIALAQQGRAAEAEAAFRQALQVQPDSPMAPNNLGSLLFGQGRIEEATTYYQRALQVRPNFAAAHYNLGHANRQQGRLDDAVRCFQQAVRFQPDHADAHNDLGNVLRELRRVNEAIPCFQEAVQLRPNFAGAHNNLGIALYQQGRLEEAIAQLQQAIRHQPTYADAYNNLGNTLQAQGQLNEAIRCYQEAVRLQPEAAGPRSNLGSALLEQGRVEEAIVHLEQAVRLQPDLQAARTNLDHALEQQALRRPGGPRPAPAAAPSAPPEPVEEPTADAPPVRARPGRRPASCYVVLPWGKTFGWGICGKYITRELARLTSVGFVTQGLNRQRAANELEYRFFIEQLASQEDIKFLEHHNDRCPVLQAIMDPQLHPFRGRVTAPYKVGYTFLENLIPDSAVKEAADYFDVIAAGSSWCADNLRAKGFFQVATVIQGVDPLIFNPRFAEKDLFTDRFVVFSGGKFEYRKGQDLVIRAFRVLQERYPDVLLINCWFNQWAQNMQSMTVSPHMRYEYRPGDFVATMNQTLARNGIDLDRVLTLPFYPSESMARIYQNTDVGLFPNRCEAGTNLVLMEYMACGKPVIASYSSGHKDIVNRGNAVLIENLRSVTMGDRHQPYATWDDPDLDETIAHLDWAYHHRAELKQLGQRAGEDLAKFTWRQTAQEFYRLLRLDVM